MRTCTYYARVENYEVVNGNCTVTFDGIEEAYHLAIDREKPNFREVRSAHIALNLQRKQLPPHIKSFKPECWYKLIIAIDSNEKSYIDGRIFHNYKIRASQKIQVTHLLELKKRSKKSKELSNIYQLKNIPGYADAITSKENILKLLPTLNQNQDFWLRVVDVGQGSCNAISLVDEPDGPGTELIAPQEILYLAAGGGVVANAGTYVHNDYYPIQGATVVLCHWDMDHWVSGEIKSEFEQTQWLVPEQKNLGISHIQFAQRLSEESRLHIWPKNLKRLDSSLIDIHKLPENKDRNYSGLVCITKSSMSSGKNAIYTGDAPFSRCKSFLSEYDISVIITPHHAGDMPFKAIPKAPDEHIVVSSFGMNNTFNHPFEGSKSRPFSTQTHYLNKGWKNWQTTLCGDKYIYSGKISDEKKFCQILNGMKVIEL
ncbi:ComEC/Rec2 family competence protein [Vibrio coralliirubri]|uniref:hypothetical protein n=1 Tax=Vibrio coralliirubri TaxID=1516159 RepID=UPI000636FB12|nr:hypothetical protein [Vibrio coralliirubri]CDU13681.1 hypothetical protein VCR17J2_540025 [Vibrio coralliirubri]